MGDEKEIKYLKDYIFFLFARLKRNEHNKLLSSGFCNDESGGVTFTTVQPCLRYLSSSLLNIVVAKSISRFIYLCTISRYRTSSIL